jgi:hypothetical protein
LKIAVWSPLSPAASEASAGMAEMLPALARHHEVVAVVEDPAAVDRAAVPGIRVVAAGSAPATDLGLYSIASAPDHVFVYRAALARPGVVVLHEWVLHDLVWHDAVDRGDVSVYLREMRRSHGEAGSLVGRQVVRGLGGAVLPTRFAANDRLIERSLAVATLTRETEALLERRHPRMLHRHLPRPVALPASPLPSRAEARQALGLPGDALIVTAPEPGGSSTPLEALVRAAETLRTEFPSLRLVLSGSVSSRELMLHVLAADVVSALRFPSRGEMPAVLVQAVGVGRPALATAGTAAAEEMPEGTVVPIDPGPRLDEDLVSRLRQLLSDERLREAIGEKARAYAHAHLGLEAAAARLAAFLGEVDGRRAELLSGIQADRFEDGSLGGYLADEIRYAARDLGLASWPLALESLVAPLARARR